MAGARAPLLTYGTTSKRRPPPKQQEKKPLWRATAVCVTIAGLVYALECARWSKEDEKRRSVPVFCGQVHCENGLCLTASNAYERHFGRAIADGLYDGLIVEVLKETRVVARSSFPEDDESSLSSCVMEAGEDLEVMERGGCQVDVMAARTGTHTLSVAATDDGGRRRSVVLELEAKYVRREVRDVGLMDRYLFLDAIAVTHAVPDAVGRKIYGDAYHSAEWFVVAHQARSGDRTCDHWHGGSGTSNHLMAFTLRYEQTLQAIDPRVSIPYWDPTVVRDASVLWSPNWFSVGDPSNALRVVDSGRWAWLPVPKGRITTKNAYGLLKVPWNTDPTPFLTRSRTEYGRQTARPLEYRLAKSLLDAMRVVVSSDSSVHRMVGGRWNYVPSYLGETQAAFNFHNVSTRASKEFWRRGLIDCPDFCADDVPPQQCTCKKATERIRRNYPNARSSWDLLNATGAVAAARGGGGKNDDDREWDLVLDQIVMIGHVGTADTESSPFDPVFWIIPGMHERYVQTIRWLFEEEEFEFDETWVSFSNGYYYDWSTISSAAEMPEDKKVELCEGHRAEDLIPYPNLLAGQPSTYVSNLEFYNLTRPFSRHLPYVYDHLLDSSGWALFGDDDHPPTTSYSSS
ncbi:hypothetical protein CTAYLR_003499 [Chrysophaeum taylorii]|uniref:Uncharacterized protein n=1 Tax=Chrysophaeum taylorii TaxID=2483200 RepID=A0AAD7UBZ0_9STRA|nr:hypothetical protein CTAYLR_003499 [Chrysophaeum taylorii]